MQERSVKGQLFDQLARIGKAVSNGKRLELIDFLAQGEKGVEALAKVSGLSVANTSQHLQQLRYAGLVSARKDKQHVYYTLSDESVIDLLGLLRVIAEKNLAEVDQLINMYLKQKDSFEPISAKDLLKRVEEGIVTVLDVRPPDEYSSGHVAGAINVPLKELHSYMKNLDSDKDIIAYCRGAYCLMSFDAVSELREKGFKAKRLQDGFPEWKKAGLPVESSK